MITITLVMLLISLMFSSCKRITAGHEGIWVNLYGSEERYNDVSIVVPWVRVTWFNPLAQAVYEYPTFVQTVDYPAFEIPAKDGLPFTVEARVSLKMIEGQSAPIFRKYRKETLYDVIGGIVFEYVKDTFRSEINKLTSEEIISKRDSFEMAVRERLATTLYKEGFQLELLTSGLTYPQSHCNCCQCQR